MNGVKLSMCKTIFMEHKKSGIQLWSRRVSIFSILISKQSLIIFFFKRIKRKVCIPPRVKYKRISKRTQPLWYNQGWQKSWLERLWNSDIYWFWTKRENKLGDTATERRRLSRWSQNKMVVWSIRMWKRS